MPGHTLVTTIVIAFQTTDIGFDADSLSVGSRVAPRYMGNGHAVCFDLQKTNSLAQAFYFSPTDIAFDPHYKQTETALF